MHVNVVKPWKDSQVMIRIYGEEIMIEWFGTAMSAIVAFSLTQKNIKRLRIINLIGSIGFSIYGFLIQAWPVVGLNMFIAVVNIYYLTQLYRRKDLFSHMTGKLDQSDYCLNFIQFYKKDIETIFPNFRSTSDQYFCLILRNMVPVSLIIYRESSPEEAEIELDYATPQYRDFKNARYFLETVIPEDNSMGYTTLKTLPRNPDHKKYLKKLGYRPEGDYFIWRQTRK